MRAIILGILFLGSAVPAWMYLSHLGMNILSVVQWKRLIVELIVNPGPYITTIIFPVVFWSIVGPFIGIFCLIYGIKPKKPEVTEIPVPKGFKPNKNKKDLPPESKKSSNDEKKEISEKKNEGVKSSFEKLKKEKSETFFSKILNIFKRKEKVTLDKEEHIDSSDDNNEEKKRFGLFKSKKSKQVLAEPMDQPEEDELIDNEARREAIPERVMTWYSAWKEAPRFGEKRTNLLGEAKIISAELTDEIRQSIISEYSISGFSALNAIDGASRKTENEEKPIQRQSNNLVDKIEKAPMPYFNEDEDENNKGIVSVDAEDTPFGDFDEVSSEDIPEDINIEDIDDNDNTISGEDGIDLTSLSSDSDININIEENNENYDDNLEESFNLSLGGEEENNDSNDDDEEEGPGPIDIEDDIGIMGGDLERSFYEDEGARKVLESIMLEDKDNEFFNNEENEENEETGSIDIKDSSEEDEDDDNEENDNTFVSGIEDPEDDLLNDEEDDRSSVSIPNEEMDEVISRIDSKKMKAILGEQEGSVRWLNQKFKEIGLEDIEDKNPMIPPLWLQLEKAVSYQTKAFAWENFGEQAPKELMTSAQREEYLIKVATSIVTLKDQIEKETINEIVKIKEGSEEISWLTGRADLILEALSSPENRERLKKFVRNRQTNKGQARQLLDRLTGQSSEFKSGLDIPVDELNVIQKPIEESLKLYAPIVEQYRNAIKDHNKVIEQYRSLQLVHVPKEKNTQPEFALVDLIYGRLKAVSTKKPEDQINAYGIIFVEVPSGNWRLRQIKNENNEIVHLLVGEGDNLGDAVNLRDHNLNVFEKWAFDRGVTAYGVIHLIKDKDTIIEGLDGTLPFEIRTNAWSDEDKETIIPSLLGNK